MRQSLSKIHQNVHGDTSRYKTKIKTAILLISSTLLISVSAYAAETKPTTAKTTINPTSINTSAINLAIMADNPTVLSETQRITKSKSSTQRPLPPQAQPSLVARQPKPTKLSILKTPFITLFGQKTAWSPPKKRLPLISA